MAKKKERRPNLVTPVGELKFPHFEEPRDYQNNGVFKYDGKLVLKLADEGVEDFLAKLQTEYEFLVGELKAAGKKFPKDASKVHGPSVSPVLDDDDEEVPGLVVLKFSVRAKVETANGKEWDRKPRIFNTAREVLEDPGMGSGTMAQVSFVPYVSITNLGSYCTMQPEAIMVHKLVTFGEASTDAADFGFGGDVAPAPSESGEPDDGSEEEGGDGSEF